jgi:hypothetical protein
MKKKDKAKADKEIVVKTTLSFEELMKKALTTPLPAKDKKKKKGK